MSFKASSLASVATFQGLPAELLRSLEDRLTPLLVERGACIVRQGDPADALHVVVSGRFAVEIDGDDDPIAEISHGGTIGEIAFFAGGRRTASVRAIRDSVVVRLTRDDFNSISASSPAIWSAITATLAERLAAETRTRAALHRNGRVRSARPRPRTIAIVGACDGHLPPLFLRAFQDFATRSGALIITSGTLETLLHVQPDAADDLTETLNGLESRFETIVFVADSDLTPWSEKAVRQADELLLVAAVSDDPIGRPVPLGAVEGFALGLHPTASRRLVLVHRRNGVIQGTRHWLSGRMPSAHHHITSGAADDVARLWRFLRGEALGFVACGGGAYCAAHVGIYRAFREAGVIFDFVGGTSGGAAMAAAFAQNLDPFEIDAGVHRMFIEGRAMRRYTLPRYSLLDHTHFDAHLERAYGNLRIEDLRTPYFAVSADLSAYEPQVHRDGSLWQAIRASAAIPGLLPPFYTDDGRMLVDGSVIANVPIATMHALKSGPNVVVSFETGQNRRFPVDYAALPKRRELLWRMFNPRAAPASAAPSAATVLVRSLMANRDHFERHLTADDWLLVPPTPPGIGALDWRRHTELMETAYLHTKQEIAARGLLLFPHVTAD